MTLAKHSWRRTVSYRQEADADALVVVACGAAEANEEVIVEVVEEIAVDSAVVIVENIEAGIEVDEAALVTTVNGGVVLMVNTGVAVEVAVVVVAIEAGTVVEDQKVKLFNKPNDELSANPN